MADVVVRRDPLLVFVRSAIEFYPSEVVGYIYGDVHDSGWIVDHAQPVQQVKYRGRSEVENTARSVDALTWGTDSLDTMLGTYHSHTRYANGNGVQLPLLVLSRADMQDMIDREERLSVLVTVNKTNRRWRLRGYRDEVYGTILFRKECYLVHLRAYYLEGRRKRIGEIKIQRRVLQKLFA